MVKVSAETLSQNNLKAYVEQHGKERAAGYLEAMADIINYYMDNLDGFSDSKKARGFSDLVVDYRDFLDLEEVKAFFDISQAKQESPHL